MRYSWVLVSFVLCCGLLGVFPPTYAQPEEGIRVIPQTRVIRIPVVAFSSADPEGKHRDAGMLTIYPGAPNELPEGPDGFDVFEDGRMLITDPLQARVVVFDENGKFLETWKVGFAADSIKILKKNTVLIREASTGDVRVFDGEGHLLSGDRPVEPATGNARLDGGTKGVVNRPSADGFRGGPLTVRLEQPGLTLVSLEWLNTELSGDTFVAIETTAATVTSEAINLNKQVRKYGSNGLPVAEVAAIPLDYYVPPVDELRVARGTVYQLFTSKSEVRINVWNMK